MALFISVFVWTSPAFCEFYKYDINTIARKAEARIKEIDKKIAEEKQKEEAQKEMEELRPMLEKAEALFNKGNYAEAKALYSKILETAKNPEVRKEARKAELKTKEAARKAKRKAKKEARKAKRKARKEKNNK